METFSIILGMGWGLNSCATGAFGAAAQYQVICFSFWRTMSAIAVTTVLFPTRLAAPPLPSAQSPQEPAESNSLSAHPRHTLSVIRLPYPPPCALGSLPLGLGI